MPTTTHQKDAMPDVITTIKLSGADYRLLCRELEYHQQTLREGFQRLQQLPTSNPDRQAAQRRLTKFQTLRDRIAG